MSIVTTADAARRSTGSAFLYPQLTGHCNHLYQLGDPGEVALAPCASKGSLHAGGKEEDGETSVGVPQDKVRQRGASPPHMLAHAEGKIQLHVVHGQR
uniref:Uncharacterized protein n=1 Tax=Oryza rufipogon TaxID=4529 RepID=A0A0E0MYA2_ORYRU